MVKSDSYSVNQTPQRVDPQKPLDGATNQLVARFSRLYAEAGPEAREVLDGLEMPTGVAVSGLVGDGAGLCGRFGLDMGRKEGNPLRSQSKWFLVTRL